MSDDAGHFSHAGDMDVETFRAAGHRLIDWVAAYLAAPERYPVFSRAAPGDVARRLPRAAPAGGEPVEDIRRAGGGHHR